MKKLFLSILCVVTTTMTIVAQESWQLGLPANSNQPKPTKVAETVSYKADIYMDNKFSQKEYYDSKTKTTASEPAPGSFESPMLMQIDKEAGKGTIYMLDPDSKTYTKFVVNKATNAPTSEITFVVYKDRWCSYNGSFYVDAETGITLRDNCSHTETVNIVLGEQPEEKFLIPDGYTENKF